MAIIWEVKITPIDVPNKIVKIVAWNDSDGGTTAVSVGAVLTGY